jgi:hypothetical protein
MKARFYTTLGFAFSTISIMTFLHIQRFPSIGEALDGLFSGLYFVSIFAGGIYGGMWIFNLRPARMRSPILTVMTGLNAGLISWFLIYALWLMPKINQQLLLVSNAFVLNSVFLFCVGVLLNVLPLYKIKTNSNDET